MVHEFFVRVLHSTGVLRISHTNVNNALGSRSPFILVLVVVTVLCYKLHLNKLRCIIQSFLIVCSVVPSDVSLVGLMIVLVIIPAVFYLNIERYGLFIGPVLAQI